jgi:hypothetical protein
MLSDWTAKWSFWSVCGDPNNSFTGPTVADLNYLVNYLFHGGAAPVHFNSGNVDNTGSITVSDLNYLIAYLWNNGPAPTCP